MVQEAINKSGVIKRKLVHSVFLGSPGSGKSSLITRLVRKELKDFSPSTGVCEPVVIVDVGIEDSSATHASVTVLLQAGEWSEAEFEVSVVRQMNKESLNITPKAMTSKALPPPAPSTASESASPVQTSTTMTAPPQPIAAPLVSHSMNPCQTSGSITSEMLTSDGAPSTASGSTSPVQTSTTPPQPVSSPLVSHSMNPYQTSGSITSEMLTSDGAPSTASESASPVQTSTTITAPPQPVASPLVSHSMNPYQTSGSITSEMLTSDGAPSTASESASPVQTSTTITAPPQPVASPLVSHSMNPCQTSGSITSEMLTSDGAPSTASESTSVVQTSTTMTAPPQPVTSPHVSHSIQTSDSITSEMLTSDGADLSRKQLLQPQPPIQNISSVIQKYGFNKVQRFLKNSYSIYLTDTGGQVEFQEMVPLLISGPSIFFFLFRIDQDIRSKFKIEYRKKDGTITNSYISSISTEDALLQCLASVDAMDITGQSDVKTHQPLVFIVGTHKDLLGSNAEEKICEINRQLNELINRHGYKDLVQYADQRSNRLMFTVDNYDEGEKDFECIRSRVSEIVIGRDEFAIDYPISYLQFSLDLENMKKSIVSFDECVALAAQYGIGKDRVKHLLRFLHTRIGRIKYFPVKGLHNIVVREPQVLFNKVTDLIVETFSSNRLCRREFADFKYSGIISASVFKTVIKVQDDIDPNSFLQLLVHLRIISQITTSRDKEDRYFIPCVLNHVQMLQTPDEISSIPTLYIEFECNHCPKGIFGVLINTLLTTTLKSWLKWELLPDFIFRDQVSFRVGCYEDRVTLKFFASHLQVILHPSGNKSRHAHISYLCNDVRKVIEKSIHSSVKDLHYDSGKTQHYFCCKCKLCSLNHRVKYRGWVQADYFMYCSKKHEICILSEDNLVWFQQKGVHRVELVMQYSYV